MNRDNGTRTTRNGGSDLLRVDVVCISTAVDKYRTRTGGTDRQCCGYVGIRRYNHLIAGTNLKRGQGQAQGIQAAADSNRVLCAYEFRECPLELLHRLAQNKIAARQHARNGSVYFGRDARVLSFEINKRNNDLVMQGISSE
jgi:hypothetical protein